LAHPNLKPFQPGTSGNRSGRPKMRFEAYAREQPSGGKDLVDHHLKIFRGEPFEIWVTRQLPMTSEQIKVAQETAAPEEKKIARRQKRYVVFKSLHPPAREERARSAQFLADRGWGRAPETVRLDESGGELQGFQICCSPLAPWD
jgi:hypothetical protein